MKNKPILKSKRKRLFTEGEDNDNATQDDLRTGNFVFIMEDGKNYCELLTIDCCLYKQRRINGIIICNNVFSSYHSISSTLLT